MNIIVLYDSYSGENKGMFSSFSKIGEYLKTLHSDYDVDEYEGICINDVNENNEIIVFLLDKDGYSFTKAEYGYEIVKLDGAFYSL